MERERHGEREREKIARASAAWIEKRGRSREKKKKRGREHGTERASERGNVSIKERSGSRTYKPAHIHLWDFGVIGVCIGVLAKRGQTHNTTVTAKKGR